MSARPAHIALAAAKRCCRLKKAMTSFGGRQSSGHALSRYARSAYTPCGRGRMRRIAQHGREGEEPVGREEGVRPAARER
ncbi:MAG: hypothetical protein ABFC38_08340 [Methanospirillum sp.]